ncbi:MAG TPA: tetratricopeptide repeat protein, partial [Gemmataceae bacterium]|nr:tetratricopeptide repeat protein [Gemmataceae bacterium]
IRTSAVHRALVAALDDWAVCAADAGRQAWLLEVARLADPDPEGWGDRVRRPKAWGDPTALAELARTAPLASRSVQLLVAVGERLQDLRGDSAGFLKRVQQQHPSDFWANFRLGNALCQSAPRDAVGYYRAALAARPGAVLVYLNLGAVLNHAGERDEAIVYYQRALELDPGSAPAHNHLAIALVGARRLDEALDHFRRALRLDPGQAGVHCNLAAVLETKGRLDEALDHYQQALRRDPKWAAAHHNLGNFLLAKGRVDEALDHLRQAAALEPTSAVLRFGLALALQKTGGRSDEAIANYEQALRLDPKLAPAHRNLGVALQASGRPEEALDHLRQAVALEPGNVLAHLTLARVLRQQGSRLDEAVRHGEQAVRLEPQSPLPHKVLGEVLLAQGRCREAEAATRRCLDLLPEAHPLRPGALKQLQRCAQWRALEDRLPAVLQGKDAPASDTERLQFAELCCLKRRYLVAAGLYAAAFDGTPQLAGGPRARHRYNAARAAAQAGCGGGDAAGLGDEERARWRRQARAWLRADVDAWAEELNRGAASARVPVRQALTRWREEPDVACVRDPGELGQLAAEERKECLALWAEVDALLARTRK